MIAAAELASIMAYMQREKDIANLTNNRIARAAGTVGVAFVISNIFGLLAKILIARTFGTGIYSNSYFAANRFSEILFNLVAGGALGSSFIPVFTGLLAREDRERAWKLASSITNLVTLVLTVFSILSIIFARQIVQLVLAPGLPPEEALLTEQLLRIQVLSSVIFGVSGLVMGMLNAHQHFLLPALAPAMYQLGIIFGVLCLAPVMGVYGLAWGVVIGAGLHLLIQLPKLLKLPERKYWFIFGLKIPEVREVARLMGPRLLGVAIVQLNFLMNTYLASYQPPGSISAISYAFPLMLMPEAVIAQSIATASLPTFSMQVAKNRLGEMRSSLSAALRMTLMLAVPATIGLVLLREPIIRVLYEGDQFTKASTDLVAWALLWYGLGLVGHCIVEISSRAFYALHDTKTPVFVGVGAMSLNLVFSFAFTALFRRIGWQPHGGLALANTIATFIESMILIVLLNRRMQGFDGKRIVQSFLKFLAAGAVMGLALQFLSTRLSFESQSIKLGLEILGGILVYLLMIFLLRSDELKSLMNFRKTGGS